MTYEQLNNWLNKLKVAWEAKNPEAAVDLCSEKIIWHENPFSKPLKTKEEILSEWQSILNQENISFSYEILITNDKFGIAQWNASFIRLPLKEKVKLDGIFKVSLDNNEKCTEFYMWFNSKE